ncbi:MAG: hypothetical protein ACRDTF_05810 [Pseudonocardiaceae bacterium]
MTTGTNVLSGIAIDPGMTPVQPPAASLPLPPAVTAAGEAPAPEHGEVGEPTPLTPPASPCSI